MAINFPGFAGPPPDRERMRAQLAERAILGGATAKRPIRRPISLNHPIRQVDRSPISCIQTLGLSHRRPAPVQRRPLPDRIARLVMTWFLRGIAAVFAFVAMAAAPGWIEAAFSAQQAPWGF